jgi:hypothetical protein
MAKNKNNTSVYKLIHLKNRHMSLCLNSFRKKEKKKTKKYSTYSRCNVCECHMAQ